MIYHFIVKQIITSNFKHLSNGNYTNVLATVSDAVVHEFLGSSAIGGRRQSKATLEQWFQRVFRLFPSFQFTVHDIIVNGWPWHTKVSVEWSAKVTPKEGPSYINTGVHIIILKWGKATKISAYENSELVATACQTMIQAGIEEAKASQIK